jgi:hypothetical protein
MDLEERIAFGRNGLLDHARTLGKKGPPITSMTMTPRASPIDLWDMYLVIEREGIQPTSIGVR